MNRKRDRVLAVGRDQHPLRRLVVKDAVHIADARFFRLCHVAPRSWREENSLPSADPKPTGIINRYRRQAASASSGSLTGCPCLAAIRREHRRPQVAATTHVPSPTQQNSSHPSPAPAISFQLSPARYAAQQTLRRRSVERIPRPRNRINIRIEDMRRSRFRCLLRRHSPCPAAMLGRMTSYLLLRILCCRCCCGSAASGSLSDTLFTRFQARPAADRSHAPYPPAPYHPKPVPG